ncbi:unnamed protein product [Ixodes hexagonus]
MSAPAAMGFAKLFYPETEDTELDYQKLGPLYSTESSVLVAVSKGLSSTMFLAAHMAASLMALVAARALLDAGVVYLGTILGWDFLSLNWLVGRLLVPLPLAMGVDVSECAPVAGLLATKATLNELAAHAHLAGLPGLLSLRAHLVSSFALCGFSNLCAVGVQLAAYTSLTPSRLGDCARVAARALVSGSVACFMTACCAGE